MSQPADAALGSMAAVFAIALIALYNILGRAVHQHYVSKTTIVNDLPKLGQLPNKKGKIRGTAVIAGGRYAGVSHLLATADNTTTLVLLAC